MEIPGPLAVPGTYRVSLAKRVDGETTPLGEAQSFNVVSISKSALPGASPEQMTAFVLRVDELNRRLSGAKAAVFGRA